MSDVNVVCLTGGLTRDPELRELPGGSHVLDIALGVGESFVGSDGQVVERSHYVDVSVYGRRAVALQPILRRGMRVSVSGRLRFESWERDGTRRSKLSVVATEIVLPPRKGPADGQDAQGGPRGQGRLCEPGDYVARGPQDAPPAPPEGYYGEYGGY